MLNDAGIDPRHDTFGNRGDINRMIRKRRERADTLLHFFWRNGIAQFPTEGRHLGGIRRYHPANCNFVAHSANEMAGFPVRRSAMCSPRRSAKLPLLVIVVFDSTITAVSSFGLKYA